uniref:Uncharacterized protein n=1 Tax=Mandrillus leucophaeus TaxID=9568 RepID=A0A2K5XNQ8_MANLE
MFGYTQQKFKECNPSQNWPFSGEAWDSSSMVSPLQMSTHSSLVNPAFRCLPSGPCI